MTLLTSLQMLHVRFYSFKQITLLKKKEMNRDFEQILAVFLTLIEFCYSWIELFVEICIVLQETWLKCCFLSLLF